MLNSVWLVRLDVNRMSKISFAPAARPPAPSPQPVSSPPAKDRRKDRLLRLKAVISRTGLSSATIYRREKDGTFPTRHPIGRRCVGWYESDIDDFVAAPLSYRA
jgi:prophage regulatory protein